MKHKVLSTGLHCLIDKRGKVRVYTESEYQHECWWQRISEKLTNLTHIKKGRNE